MQRLLRQVLIQSLTQHPGPWLLALSAGLDSSVLLFAIRQLWPEQNVHAVHVNHGLQDMADDFEAGARSLCLRLGVECHVSKLHKPEVFENGLEAWARQARYAAIESVARDLKVDTILLAHHADDQAETFFINLIRGTGIDGLRGMPAIARCNGFLWLRPLLRVHRSVIREQAKLWKLPWVEDPSNADRVYLRNRIRHELMPLLEAIRPGANQRVVHLMQDLAQTREQESRVLAAPSACSAELDLGALYGQSSQEQRLTLHAWAKKVTQRAPSRARLNAMYELCFVSKTGRGHLRHGLYVFRRNGDRLRAEPICD